MDRSIESIICKVLENEATVSEQQALAAWRALSVENEAEFQSFKILFADDLTDESSEPPLDLEGSRKKLMGIIHRLETRRRTTAKLRMIASVVLFLLTVLVSTWNIVSEVSASSQVKHFKDASFSSVAAFLADEYDVTLSLTGNMDGCRFDGYIVVNGSGDEITKTLLNAMKLTYKIESPSHFLISGTCAE